jgi:peptide deformylase
MAILKIARMGHPVLAQRAQEVADPTAPEIARLVEDMTQTMFDAQGRGLAAPQVHVPLRVVVFITPEDAAYPGVTAIVNPVITVLTEEMTEGWEGCLSVPGLRGLVPRHTRLRYTGVAPDGTPIDRTVEGFHAVVVQHEFDHLDGVLYPRRMDDLGKLIFDSEMRWFLPRRDIQPDDALEEAAQ